MVCCVCCGLVTLIVGALIYFFNRWYRRDFISDFNNKCVFITGTDSGFGYKLAVDLDSIGLHVFAGCLTQEGAQKLKKETSERLKTVSLDVTSQTSVEGARSFIEDNLPPGKQLWGLVNNAGIGGNFVFSLSTLEDYRKTMEVNYFGSIRVVEVFEQLIKKSKGRIVQVSSVFGRGSSIAPPYTCSKFAIEPYTDELRRYMRQFGVKVCTIEPGGFLQTSIFNSTVWQEIIRQRFEALPLWKKDELGNDFAEREIQKISGSLEKYPTAKYNKVSMVTEAMSHGLGAKHPKTRYLVGYDARPYVLFTGYTPDWLLDATLRLMYWRSNK